MEEEAPANKPRVIRLTFNPKTCVIMSESLLISGLPPSHKGIVLSSSASAPVQISLSHDMTWCPLSVYVENIYIVFGDGENWQ